MKKTILFTISTSIIFGIASSAFALTEVEFKKAIFNATKFSPDKKFFVIETDTHKLTIYNLTNNKKIETTNGHKNIINDIVFSPNGKTFATISEDKTVKIWNVETGKENLNIKAGNYGVYSTAFSNDGKSLATGSFHEIKLWNVNNGKQISQSNSNSYVSSLVFSKDDKYLATGGYKTITFFKVPELKKYYNLPNAHKNFVSSLTFNPVNRLLASSSLDQTVKFWDWTITNKKKLSDINKDYKDFVTKIEFSPDGKLLATGSMDKTIKVLDLYNRKILKKITEQKNPNAFTFNSDGTKLLIGNSDGKITYLDLK